MATFHHSGVPTFATAIGRTHSSVSKGRFHSIALLPVALRDVPVISSTSVTTAINSTSSPSVLARALPLLKYTFQPIRIPEQAARDVQCGCQAASASQAPSEKQDDTSDYVVVNFYHLVDVPDPQQLVEDHKAWVASNKLDIRGRIYYSAQGVNAQYGGKREEALAYLNWLKSQDLWKGIRHTVWPSPVGQAFPKLRLKYKPNLISLAGGISGLPVTKAEARATPLEPSQWKQMLADAEERKVVVLDVRNDYEWDAGHFKGAERPREEVFAQTPVGEEQQDIPEPLRGADPNTPVMMYCTGGIRCDIYSTFLKTKGFNNLYTLEGGIQNYLKEEGSQLWNGSLYVFDGRMAISGDQRYLETSAGDPHAAATSGPLKAAVPCQVCGAAEAELPHVNCANIDCNELFIACAACKTQYRGCCCSECMSAPRLLRPPKTEAGYYGAWGNYADGEEFSQAIATGRRREGRVARRAKHREALKAKRAKIIEERQARKNMMREAMAKLELAEQQRQEDQQKAGSRDEGAKEQRLSAV